MEQETIVARKVPTEVSIALLNSDLEKITVLFNCFILLYRMMFKAMY